MTEADIQALEQIYAQWAQGDFWSFESFDEHGQAVAIRAYSDRGRAMREAGLAQ